MVVTDGTHMPQQASDVLPSREVAGVHDDTGQRLVGFEPAVDGLRQRVEVLCTQGRFDLDHNNPGLGQELVGDARPFGQ